MNEMVNTESELDVKLFIDLDGNQTNAASFCNTRVGNDMEPAVDPEMKDFDQLINGAAIEPFKDLVDANDTKIKKYETADRSADMGIWSRAWNRYRQFENLEFNRSHGISVFLSEWEDQLSGASEAGCHFTDLILTFKLLEKCRFAPRDVELFLSVVEGCENDSDLYLKTLAYVCKAFESPDERDQTFHLKEEDGFEGEDKVAARFLDMVKSDNTTVNGRSSGTRASQRKSAKRSARKHAGSPPKRLKVANDDDLDLKRDEDDIHDYDDVNDIDDDFAINQDDKKLSCDLCDYRTNYAPSLGRHKQAIHNSVSEYPCDLCEEGDVFVGETLKQLKQHRDQYHQHLKNSCKHCPFVAPNVYRLVKHTKLEHSSKLFSCDKCPYNTWDRTRMKGHQLKHDPLQVLLHICDECGYTAKQATQLIKHKRHKHEKLRSAPCDQCDHVAFDRPSLKVHIMSVHENVRMEPCNLCEYVARTKTKLSIHKRIKHEGVRIPCNQCSFQAITKSHLKKHQQMVHEGIRYHCNQCDYVGSKKENLKLHHENKHQGIRYPCDRCDKKFTKKGILKRHIDSVHEGIKYLCDKCDFVASQKSQLSKHQKTKHKSLL